MALNKDAVRDLSRVKEEFNAIVESLELMEDRAFMRSYRKAKAEIRSRDFDHDLSDSFNE